MDETVRAVLCPCCGKLLCALECDVKRHRWHFTKDSPELKHDHAGLYMACGKCGRRVAFASTSGPTPFELAPVQDCEQL